MPGVSNDKTDKWGFDFDYKISQLIYSQCQTPVKVTNFDSYRIIVFLLDNI